MNYMQKRLSNVVIIFKITTIFNAFCDFCTGKNFKTVSPTRLRQVIETNKEIYINHVKMYTNVAHLAFINVNV